MSLIWHEMNYYDKIASSYNGLYSEEQRKKLRIIKEKIRIPRKTRVLDIGCGTGISSEFENFVVGIDSSIELLKLNKKDKKILGRAESLPFKNHSFDLVISLTAIQNFDNANESLREIKRVGKKVFVVSALKKSPKIGNIKKLIQEHFKVKEILEEEKDLIFFLEA